MLAVLLYAQDYDNWVVVRDQTQSWIWWELLAGQKGHLNHQGPDYLVNLNLIVCPSARPYKFDYNTTDAYSKCYTCHRRGTLGSSDVPPTNPAMRQFGLNSNDIAVGLHRIQNPSTYIWLFEAYSIPWQAQSFYGKWDGDSDYGLVDMRHTGMCNVAFADGHVEAWGQSQLKTAGFTVGFKSGVKVTF